MTDFDPSELTIEERRKIEKNAKRNVRSEVILILSAGFSTILVILFFLAQYSFLPIAEAIGVRPSVVWVGLSALIAFICAALHASRSSRTTAHALAQQFKIQQFDESKKRSETADKLRNFKTHAEP